MTRQDYERYSQYMALRKNIHHENLCDVIDAENRIDSNWCSSYFKTHVAMQYSEESLAEELLRRRRLTRDDPGKWMSEPEMWYVIRSVSSASAELEKNGLLHGDIQPRHILIMNDERIKLFEAPLLSQYFTGANRMLQEQDYHAALSPQELDALRNDLVYRTMNPGIAAHNVGTPVNITPIHANQKDRNADIMTPSGDLIKKSHLSGTFPDYNVRHEHNEKDEVFSLGITALCSACNNPLADFYDYKTLELNRAKINQKIDFMRELGYSGELINLITGMLQENPAQRLSMVNVLQIVNQPHQVITTNNGQPVVIGQTGPGGFATSTLIPGPGLAQFPPGQIPPQGGFNPGVSAFMAGTPQRPGPVGPPQGQFNGQAPMQFNGQAPGQFNVKAPPQFNGQVLPPPQGPISPGMSSFQGAPFQQNGFAGQGAMVAPPGARPAMQYTGAPGGNTQTFTASPAGAPIGSNPYVPRTSQANVTTSQYVTPGPANTWVR